MQTPLDATSLGVVGAVLFILFSLLAWIIRQVATGSLIPRSVHEARLSDRDSRIQDLLAANERSAKQAEQLTSIGTQQVHILDEIAALAKERKDDNS